MMAGSPIAGRIRNWQNSGPALSWGGLDSPVSHRQLDVSEVTR